MLDIIREEINLLGESINMDPNTKESTKEYYAYVKKLFSDVRLVKAAGAADIIGALHFINKNLSNDELFQRYRMIKEMVNKQLTLVDGEKKGTEE